MNFKTIMNKIWRWDQGRLNYFQYSNLQLIAQSIMGLDGTTINIKDLDPLRYVLESRELVSDDIFTEGKRVRVTHMKIERSPLLRKLYFDTYPTTICNMCTNDTKKKYPWTDNLLEIHHVLPLASTLTVTSNGTSLEDIVPLCPTCHRSVHAYYRIWLNTHLVSDFQSKNEALQVYNQSKSEILL